MFYQRQGAPAAYLETTWQLAGSCLPCKNYAKVCKSMHDYTKTLQTLCKIKHHTVRDHALPMNHHTPEQQHQC